jgi:hypothetical protein
MDRQLLVRVREENMSPRNTTPDEFDIFEDDAERHGEPDVPERPQSEPAVGKEIDRDHDGLPDEPAKYRVPS